MTDYPWIKVHKSILEIVVSIDKIAIGASTRRVIFKTKRRIYLFWHHVCNFFLFWIGYRLLDAQCIKCSEYRVFCNLKEITDTTTKALVPLERQDSKRGWAIRVTVDDQDRMIAGDDGKPIYYKSFGVMFWEPTE